MGRGGGQSPDLLSWVCLMSRLRAGSLWVVKNVNAKSACWRNVIIFCQAVLRAPRFFVITELTIFY